MQEIILCNHLLIRIPKISCSLHEMIALVFVNSRLLYCLSLFQGYEGSLIKLTSKQVSYETPSAVFLYKLMNEGICQSLFTLLLFALCSSTHLILLSPLLSSRLSLPVFTPCWLWWISTFCQPVPGIAGKKWVWGGKGGGGEGECCTNLPLAVAQSACSQRQSTPRGRAGMGAEIEKNFEVSKRACLTKAKLTVEFFCLRGRRTENELAWQVSTSRVKQFSCMTLYLLAHYTVSHKDMTCSLGRFRVNVLSRVEYNTTSCVFFLVVKKASGQVKSYWFGIFMLFL